jgi:hypothetical protein
MPDEPPLPVADGGEGLGEFVRAPVEPGPTVELVNIYSPHLLRRLYPVISAFGKGILRYSCGEYACCSPQGDCEIMHFLAGKSCDEIEKDVTELLKFDDPPSGPGKFRGVASQMDAFFAVQATVTPTDLKKFLLAAEIVLLEKIRLWNSRRTREPLQVSMANPANIQVRELTTRPAKSTKKIPDMGQGSSILCAKYGRAEIGDQKIGRILSALIIGGDGVWPCKEVRSVLEECGTADIAKGQREGPADGCEQTPGACQSACHSHGLCACIARPR